MIDANGSFESKLADAVEQRDAVLVRQLMEGVEFVILCVDDEEDDDEEAANLLSADIEGMDVLVAFSDEDAAKVFVETLDDIYDEDDEIQGYVLDGGALLDYMPGEHGLLINPESEESLVIDLELVELVRKAEA